MTSNASPLADLYARLRAGEISRRSFLQRAGALGVGAGIAGILANTGSTLAAGGSLRNGLAFAAQDGTAVAGASPAATPGTSSNATRPAFGTENQTRGEGGDLRLIQWQAPTTLSPHNGGGTKDFLAGSIVLEPLQYFLPDGTIIPNLVQEVPTVENGLLAADLTSVTYHLLPDVTWSDGEPFTAEDVRFTWQWVRTEENASTNYGVFAPITDIKVVDPLTVTVTFDAPNPLWYQTHTGTNSGYIYPAHILKDGGKAASDAFAQKPIGTGAFVVDSFTPNDQVIYVANEKYREPNKPYFSRVILKGGGDPASAARAVLETAEYDFAWYVQIEPELLREMESKGKGKLVIPPGSYVERLNLNFSDPNTEVDGQRSQKDTPHPFLSDKAVRQALATAIDRETIANSLYFGKDNLEHPGRNIITGIPGLESPNTTWEYDPEKAKQLLDAAGWVQDGDVRKKGDVELKLEYHSPASQLRAKEQQIVKANLEEVGFKVNIQQVDPGIYFDSSAGNDQSGSHSYFDVGMAQGVANTPAPLSFMEAWYAGPNGENIAQKENGWTGQNSQRYQNADYDALLDQARVETDPERLAELFIQLNDIIINDYAIIPLAETGVRDVFVNSLREENLSLGGFDYHYWNIANWNRVDSDS